MMLSWVTPSAFASASREFITFMTARLPPMQSLNRMQRLSAMAIFGASKTGDTVLSTSTSVPSLRCCSINSLNVNPTVVPPNFITICCQAAFIYTGVRVVINLSVQVPERGCRDSQAPVHTSIVKETVVNKPNLFIFCSDKYQTDQTFAPIAMVVYE